MRNAVPVVLGVLVTLLAVGRADAQPTTIRAYEQMATDCLAGAPGTFLAFELSVPPRMAYLRTALVDHWQREQRTVYLADTAGVSRTLPLLTYDVEMTNVHYARAPGRRLRRSVTLGLRYTLIAPDGRLLADRSCLETYEDTLRRSDIAQLESAGLPETQGALPPAGWARRFVEPAALAAATIVATYLFFSLRSRQSETE
jgi:hypothetical protein